MLYSILNSKQKQLHGHKSNKMCESTLLWIGNFEEKIDLSHFYLAVLMIILFELFTTWFHDKTELRIFTNLFYFLKAIRFFTKDKRNKLTRLAGIGLKLSEKIRNSLFRQNMLWIWMVSTIDSFLTFWLTNNLTSEPPEYSNLNSPNLCFDSF